MNIVVRTMDEFIKTEMLLFGLTLSGHCEFTVTLGDVVYYYDTEQHGEYYYIRTKEG